MHHPDMPGRPSQKKQKGREEFLSESGHTASEYAREVRRSKIFVVDMVLDAHDKDFL
jgi:hypothetical protein